MADLEDDVAGDVPPTADQVAFVRSIACDRGVHPVVEVTEHADGTVTQICNYCRAEVAPPVTADQVADWPPGNGDDEHEFCLSCDAELACCACYEDAPDDDPRSVGCVLGTECCCPHPFHTSDECFTAEWAEEYFAGNDEEDRDDG